MRRTVSVLSVILLISITLLSVFSASAATDFVVEDGVLLEYNGSSENVIIPADVFYIADSVFEGNTDIVSVDLNGASVIGNKAFYGCISLRTVTDSSHVSACGAYAFHGTPYLESNPEKNVIIGSVLLSSSASDSFTVPADVSAIAPYAFVNNINLKSVTIGESVTSIGEGAFYGCTTLSTVNVADNVTYIGAYAFDDTKFLSSFSSDYLILGNGILVAANTTASDVTIPDNVRQIAAGAFYLNSSIKSVRIPDSVTAIGMRAFAQCKSLKSVELPDSLILLDREAFWKCTSLRSVEVPASLQLIGDSVFLGCSSLETAAVYSNAPISKGMFADCMGLKSVMLASSSESIGQYAFYLCPSLSEVSIPPTVRSIAQNVFQDSSKVQVYCDEGSFAWQSMETLDIQVYKIGDANLDGKLNIRDATHIQKSVASLVTLDFSGVLRGDADFNGVINIRDATSVQKTLAGIR